ncbi:MAG: anion permease, partial [Gemmatimonadota bacterium]
MKLLLAGGIIPAHEALAVGPANEPVMAKQLTGHVMNLADTIAQRGPVAVRPIRQYIPRPKDIGDGKQLITRTTAIAPFADSRMRHLPRIAGPVLFAATLLLDPQLGMSEPAWRVAGLAAWMAVWWLSAIVPLQATALLPLIVLPLMGTGDLRGVAASYADPVIFLFLGGFLLAATLERWELHRR